MSLVLRFDPRASAPGLLSLAAGVAVCDVAGAAALVKWPNDVVIRREQGLGKLAGILIEGRPQEGWVVLGIGCNVALRLDRLPAEVQPGAASLGLGVEDVEPVLQSLLTALAVRLSASREATVAAWRARDALEGRHVRWGAGEGVAAGVDDAGRLLVELSGGGLEALDSGEVHLLP